MVPVKREPSVGNPPAGAPAAWSALPHRESGDDYSPAGTGILDSALAASRPWNDEQWNDSSGSSSEGTDVSDMGFEMDFDSGFDSGSDTTFSESGTSVEGGAAAASTTNSGDAATGPPMGYSLLPLDQLTPTEYLSDAAAAASAHAGSSDRWLMDAAPAATHRPGSLPVPHVPVASAAPALPLDATVSSASSVPPPSKRAARRAGHEKGDGEPRKPATAGHLPRHHPLVGLAGKVQGAVDEPLVCPLCNRHCEEHHRLGFHCEYCSRPLHCVAFIQHYWYSGCSPTRVCANSW